MSVEIDLGGGQGARLRVLDGERIEVHSDRAGAPGSRVEGQALGRTLRFKVHRCVREGEGFAIRGRVIDLTRAHRDALLAALDPG